MTAAPHNIILQGDGLDAALIAFCLSDSGVPYQWRLNGPVRLKPDPVCVATTDLSKAILQTLSPLIVGEWPCYFRVDQLGWARIDEPVSALHMGHMHLEGAAWAKTRPLPDFSSADASETADANALVIICAPYSELPCLDQRVRTSALGMTHALEGPIFDVSREHAPICCMPFDHERVLIDPLRPDDGCWPRICGEQSGCYSRSGDGCYGPNGHIQRALQLVAMLVDDGQALTCL